MKKILVVDDNEEICDLLKVLFEAEELGEIHTANNGLEALPIINNVKIDLVLSDMMMPKMNGPNLYLEVKKNHPKLPFVFMTGFIDHDEFKAFFESHKVEVLKKPQDFKNLSETLRKYLSGNV